MEVDKMSKKLDASLKKVDKLFQKMYEKGINPNPKEKRWSENTRDTYSEMFKAFVRDYHEAYGIADVTKMTDEDKINQLIQRRVDNYHKGQTNEASNLKTLLASMKSFNLGTEKTNIFKKSFLVGNPDEIRKDLKEQNVIRSSKTTPILRATPNECQSVLDNIKNNGYKTATREVAYHVGKIAMLTGGRITSILKLKANDFVIDKKTNEIQFVKDKGGLSRSVKIGKDTAEYLESLRQGKSESNRIFSTIRTKRDKGTFKPVKELRKEVERIVSNAGKHLDRTVKATIRGKDGKPKTVDVKQKFTPHSFRKSFALDRTTYYFQKFDSKNAINNYVARRIQEDKKIKEKLDTLRDRINKDRKSDRDLKPIEYAIFFASVDLGHFRNDVITAYYTTYKEVMTYAEEEGML